jgi:hypothetical protein
MKDGWITDRKAVPSADPGYHEAANGGRVGRLDGLLSGSMRFDGRLAGILSGRAAPCD